MRPALAAPCCCSPHTSSWLQDSTHKEAYPPCTEPPPPALGVWWAQRGLGSGYKAPSACLPSPQTCHKC